MMSAKKYSHILFDLDNTLLDFGRASKLAFTSTIHFLGHQYSDNQYLFYKQINKVVWQDYEKGTLSKEGIIKTRWTRIHDMLRLEFDPFITNNYYLDQLVVHSELIDGAIELLNELYDRKIIMALITNGFMEVQKQKIKKLGLSKYFTTIVISDEIGVNKPDVPFFEHTLQALNNPDTRQVLVVGDNLGSDILGGVQYGLDTCWYNPYQEPNEKKIKPTFEITDYEPLMSLT